SVRADYPSRSECLPLDVDLRILGGGPCERDQGCFLANFSPECTRAIEEKMVKQAALDADHAVVTDEKVDAQLLATDGNEFHCVDHTMRPISNFFCQLEPRQHRPARRIKAIATDFLAWKFFALQNERSQSRGRAKRRAGGTVRPAADNRYIDNFHSVSV